MSKEQNTATLERIAQRRSVWRRVHEYANVPRKAREGKEEAFGAQMLALRKVDDYARMMASGIKQDLKAAKQALKDEYHPSYIDIFHYLFKISDALKNVADRASKLTERRDEALKPVQTRTSLSDAELLHLERRMEPQQEEELEKAAQMRAMLLKMSRPQAAKTLEAIHGNILGERYQAAYELVHDRADKLVNTALRAFKLMDKARAKGEPGSFINALSEIGTEQAEFQTGLEGFYQSHVKPLIKARRGEEEEEPEKKEPEEPEDKETEAPAEEKDEKDKKDEDFEDESEKKTTVPDITDPNVPQAKSPYEPTTESFHGEGLPEIDPGIGATHRHRLPAGTPGGLGGRVHKVNIPSAVTTTQAPGPQGILPEWQQFQVSDPWAGAQEFEWEPAWVGPDDKRPTMKGPPVAEAYGHLLGMVKQAMQAGDQKAAGRIMGTYSNALMQNGLKDEAYEARVMALELLNDDK